MTNLEPPAKTQSADEKLLPFLFDAIKLLGTGNGAGVFGAGVGLYYFATRDPQILKFIKVGAGSYLVGIFTFALAYYSMMSAVTYYYLGLKSDLYGQHSNLVVILASLVSLVAWLFGTFSLAVALYYL